VMINPLLHSTSDYSLQAHFSLEIRPSFRLIPHWIRLNLSATLARAGKYEEALPYFRQAASLAPDNPGVLMGLAHCLDSIEEHQKEALKVYKEVTRRFPNSQFAEGAKQILNKAGQKDLRKVVEDGYRPDVVEYMIGAMKRFAEIPREQVGRVTLEIARLGETGLEINNPAKRYSLTNIEGDFSGLQLLCYMHVGMALFSPKVDCGSGLQREYEIAKAMTGK